MTKRSRIDIIGQNGNDGIHYSESNSDLPTDYQKYIHTSRYARWQQESSKRETWPETVQRYFEYFNRSCKHTILDEDDWGYINSEVKPQVLDLSIMPSMRALMTAGKALDKDNVAGYNCAYLAMNRVRAFDEVLYILMCGTGVGFSVERQYINDLPEIPKELHETDTVIVVADSKIGWAKAYRELISLLYSGLIPHYDLSKLRPAGARLNTFGGRSSGPEPLHALLDFTVNTFRKAVGRRLNSLEVHDIVCKIADVVVVGGVRRSALISLSNLTDERMRHAKSGAWYTDNPERSLANNSVCYTEHPDVSAFLKEWRALYESKAGERGIFSRIAAKEHIQRLGRRDSEHDWGCNPCSEIMLRDREFCNLTEVVIRPQDTFDDLKRKVRNATILGTLQSSLTNFRYLTPKWKENCEEERLLGVSLTGIMDHPMLCGKGFDNAIESSQFCSDEDATLAKVLTKLKEVAIETNKVWAAKLGINPSCAITCVKPSGTVSQLVDSSSGIHPRFSQYYIRRVRSDNKDPLNKFLKDQGVPCEEDVTKPGSVDIFSFPMKAPLFSVLKNNISAIGQLNLWKVYAEYWCEHKPSVTIYVKENEWLDVAAWVYNNFNIMSGVSFLPHSDHIYKQAPYEEITEEQYNELVAKMPKIDWKAFDECEKSDNTTASQELACVAGACDL